MAVNLGSRNTRNAYGNAVVAAPVSEINVTPLVDVMLVLLIVFMVAAPLMTSGVKVDLPTSQAQPLKEEHAPIQVSLTGDGKVFVDKTEVSAASLGQTLDSAAGGDKSREIDLHGDKALSYGSVIRTMGSISDAGFSKIALVSEPPKSN
ncbi:biopolymer transporter ExbD [Paraburkholderia xenovorans]|uniref:ExbD/TolR family protein n=1 Tax=Paraburkholderia xenovorans TaxID=36873 RepID=UPI0038B9F725